MRRKTDEADSRFFEKLTRRAIDTRAALLASELDRYARDEGLTWDGLARQLGCPVDALHRIAACGLPRAEQFREDVIRIAGDDVDAERLLPILRRIQVLNALRGTSNLSKVAEGPHLFLAARDRGELEEDPEDV